VKQPGCVAFAARLLCAGRAIANFVNLPQGVMHTVSPSEDPELRGF